MDEYSPKVGIHKSSVPLDARWYYATMEDARSIGENRIPNQTLFDAYSTTNFGATVSQIPHEIPLILDKPTEIDFQKYFPTDKLSFVEVLRLDSTSWRRINNTTIAFEMQKEKKEILVRITTDNFKRDYKTILVTRPPTLGIKNVDLSGNISGVLSAPVSLPLGIQSYIDSRGWTLGSPIISQDKLFSTSITRLNPTFDIAYDGSPLATIDRSSGSLISTNNLTALSPIIILGKTIGYFLAN